MNQPPYGQPVTRRSGLSPWAIVGIVLAGCTVFGIAGVAILAAIMFPVFSSARTAAQRASCMSNVKMMSTAVMMYSQDFDDKLPPAATWEDGIYPYVKSPRVYVCPTRQELVSGYAYNSLLDRRPFSKVNSPATAPMVFDSSLGAKNGSDKLQSFDARHLGTGILSYADGHVRAVSAAPPANTGLAPFNPAARARKGKR